MVGETSILAGCSEYSQGSRTICHGSVEIYAWVEEAEYTQSVKESCKEQAIKTSTSNHRYSITLPRTDIWILTRAMGVKSETTSENALIMQFCNFVIFKM